MRVEALEREGHGSLGGDDLYLQTPDGDLTVCLCHEGDVHLEYALSGSLGERIHRLLPEEDWIWSGAS